MPDTATIATKTTSKLDDFEAAYDKYFPFIAEIRNRLFFLAAIFLISAIIGFANYQRIVTFILNLFDFTGVNVVFTSPFQFINLAISAGIFTGFLTVFPLLVYQVLSFLKPALSPKEFRVLLKLAPLSLILFVGGFAFGIGVMKYVVILFQQKALELEIGNILDISQLLSQIIITAAFMGVAFQFPMVLTILMKLNILRYKVIAGQRVIAYAASLIFAALLPPTDLLSLGLLTLPLVLLFELTLLFNRHRA